MVDTKRLAGLRDEVAIVGVGETDYAEDYRRARAGERYHDSYGYAAIAFARALADSGLQKSEIDGLIANSSSLAYERMAEIIGIEPRWACDTEAMGSITEAVLAICGGMAETVALVYGLDQRTAGLAYGGHGAVGADKFISYSYFNPWGMTSQGAIYGLMMRRYMEQTGMTSADLGQVAVAERQFAALNPNAVMRKPITIEDYLAAPFLAEPFRLLDYCLVNDGGVALIVCTTERAKALGRPFVTVSGLARADMNIDATAYRPRMTFYRPVHATASEAVYDMAGVGREDIDVVGIYDSFSAHVIFALEGFGFAPYGEAAKFIREVGIGPGGGCPVNTYGGHLSGSYMQGWAHQAELVRQVRGDAGDRQVPNVRHGQYISDTNGKTVSVIFSRSEA